jgi:hypothetical protein
MTKFEEIESSVKWLNVLLFQWLFVRLFATVEEDDTVTALGFFFGAVPLTGWRGDYVYVTRDRKPRLLWVRFL